MAELSIDAAKTVINGAKVAKQGATNPWTPSNKPANVEATSTTVKFDRERFMNSGLAQPPVDARGRKLSEGVAPKEVEFTKEVMEGLTGFSRDYAQQLLTLQDKGHLISYGGTKMTVYDAMEKQGGVGEVDKYLLDLLAPKDSNGVRRLIDANTANSLMAQHPEMMENTAIIVGRFARDTLACVGYRPEMIEAGNRPKVGDLGRDIDLPVDQGPLRAKLIEVKNWLQDPLQRGGRDTSWSNLRAASAVVGLGAAGGTAAGLALGIAVPPIGVAEGILAGGVALGPATMAGLARITRGGPRIHFSYDQDILNQAQERGNQLRAKYLIGIDPGDSQITPQLADRIQGAKQLIYLRNMYMRGLGVPPQQLDALNDQFLYVSGQRPEQTSDKMSIELHHRFEEMGGRRAGITPDNQRKIWRKAEEAALVSRFEQIRDEKTRVTPDDPKRLRAAIEGRGPNGVITEARKKNAAAEKVALGVDKGKIGTTAESITGYQEKLKAVAAKRQELQKVLSTINGGALDYDHALTVLQQARNQAGATVDILTPAGIVEPITDLTTDRINHTRALSAELNAITPYVQGQDRDSYKEFAEEERKAIRLSHQAETNEDARRLGLLDTAISSLTTLHSEIETAEKEAMSSPDASSTEATKGTQALTEVHDAYDRIVAILTPPAPPVGPPAPAIPIGIDYDVLINNINASAIGWPKDENNLPENRLTIERALIQFRTNVSMHDVANIPNNVVLEGAFEAVVNNATVAQRISAMQLRAMDIPELNQRATQLGIALTPAFTVELGQAKQWASAQVEYTQRAIQEETRAVEAREQTQDRLIRNVNPEAEVAQLNMILGIVEDRERIEARAFQAFRNDRPALEDSAHVAPGVEGYTQAEVASGLPRNILEIINITTNYQNAADRNGAFTQIWTNLGGNTLGPGRLLGILDRTLGRQLAPTVVPAGAPVPALTPDVFAGRLTNTIQHTHRLNAGSFGEFTIGMVREFNDWSKNI